MKTIKLTQGKIAIIDDDDFDRINKIKWCAINDHGFGFYSTGRINKKLQKMHRYITNCPKGLEVDHINGNKLDNRKSNLRICNHQQNCCRNFYNYNQKRQTKNTNGFKGVVWDNQDKKWRVRIKHDGKNKSFGYFDNPIIAAIKYNSIIRVYKGEFAVLNKIPLEPETRNS